MDHVAVLDNLLDKLCVDDPMAAKIVLVTFNHLFWRRGVWFPRADQTPVSEETQQSTPSDPMHEAAERVATNSFNLAIEYWASGGPQGQDRLFAALRQIIATLDSEDNEP